MVMHSRWCRSVKRALSFRSVELALRLDFLAREVAEIVGAPVLSIQGREVVKAISEERVSQSRVWMPLCRNLCCWSAPKTKPMIRWISRSPPVMEDIVTVVQ